MLEMIWNLGDQNYGTVITTDDIGTTTQEFNVRCTDICFYTLLNQFCMFKDIEAECQDDYMKIRIGFNGSFNGLLYSAGRFCG